MYTCLRRLFPTKPHPHTLPPLLNHNKFEHNNRYMECSLYLARLLMSCGDSTAAAELLAQLDADVEKHELTLPEGQAAQLSLLLQKASLHLKLGQRDAFASSLLPQFNSLIEQAENNAAVVTAAKKVCCVSSGGGQRGVAQSSPHRSDALRFSASTAHHMLLAFLPSSLPSIFEHRPLAQQPGPSDCLQAVSKQSVYPTHPTVPVSFALPPLNERLNKNRLPSLVELPPTWSRPSSGARCTHARGGARERVSTYIRALAV